MEAECVRMQKKYYEDERFPNNLLKMLKNASIDG